MSWQEQNGVEIARVSHYIPRRAGRVLQRLAMEGSFCLAALFATAGRDWDVILYVGAQPSIAMLARLLSLCLGLPYAVNINDLAAEAAGDVGIVRRGWLLRILRFFEFTAYRKAAGAMVLCDSFHQALVAEGYEASRVRLIRPPVDLDSVQPQEDDGAFRKEHSLLPSDFVVMFTGSMGLKQGLTTVVEAARLLKNTDPQIKWVLVGDGEQRDVLETMLRDGALVDRVRLLPFQPVERLSAMYASADLLLLSQLRTVKDSVIPSKLLTYMAAGRAVLAAVNETSQGAVLLREADGGWLVSPEDPAALAEAVQSALRTPDVLKQMRSRNREYAVNHFDQKKVVAAQEEFLRERVAVKTGIGVL